MLGQVTCLRRELEGVFQAGRPVIAEDCRGARALSSPARARQPRLSSLLPTSLAARPLLTAAGALLAWRDFHPQFCLQPPPAHSAVSISLGVGWTPFLLPAGLCSLRFCPHSAAPSSRKPPLSRNRGAAQCVQRLRGHALLPRPHHMVTVWSGAG